jgi:hypothetical protein
MQFVGKGAVTSPYREPAQTRRDRSLTACPWSGAQRVAALFSCVPQPVPAWGTDSSFAIVVVLRDTPHARVVTRSRNLSPKPGIVPPRKKLEELVELPRTHIDRLHQHHALALRSSQSGKRNYRRQEGSA